MVRRNGCAAGVRAVDASFLAESETARYGQNRLAPDIKRDLPAEGELAWRKLWDLESHLARLYTRAPSIETSREIAEVKLTLAGIEVEIDKLRAERLTVLKVKREGTTARSRLAV